MPIAAAHKHVAKNDDAMAKTPGRRYADRMENRPIVRRAILVMLVFLAIAMAGMLALGLALYRT